MSEYNSSRTSKKNKILINVNKNEIRVAVVRDNVLYNLDIERSDVKKQKGNIYLVKVTSVAPNLDAVFVDYGAGPHGFLPIKNISYDNFKTAREKEKGEKVESSELKIEDKVYEGQELLVQVDKEQRSNKGASLTTFISLAGSFLILMPNNPRVGGISKRIEGEERSKLREIRNQLNVKDNMGVIIRTAGIHKSLAELQWDLDLLQLHWNTIQSASKKLKAPCLIHQEQNIIIRTLRDHLRADVDEIVVDDEETHQTIKDYLEQVEPALLDRLQLHTKDQPLFQYADIEDKIATIFQHEVSLPSGGTIVIDHTEAIVAVDVNSARATKTENIEETARATNLEAAEEIARQLRLRDIGGLIVIDFIDMLSSENRAAVENALRGAVALDRARAQIGRISKRFGLIEMSRQRLRTNLSETSLQSCPRCKGRGMIYGVLQFATLMLRNIKGEAIKALRNGKNIMHVQVPNEIAAFLFNEKRHRLLSMEGTYRITIMIIPNPYFNIPDYNIKLLRATSGRWGSRAIRPSYQSIDPPLVETPRNEIEDIPLERPAVKVAMTKPKPPSKKASQQQQSLLLCLWQMIFGKKESKPLAHTPPPSNQPEPQPTPQTPSSGQHNRRSGYRGHNKNYRRHQGRHNPNHGQNRSRKISSGSATRDNKAHADHREKKQSERAKTDGK